jgi:asparagine synthase (glutamine-hydrolysing)
LPWSVFRRSLRAVGGDNAWLYAYTLMSVSKMRFFNRSMRDALADHSPCDDLQLNLDRMRRWHPLSRSLYLGARVHLPGLHLGARGDRAAMYSSVEMRYPFLDEELFTFLARLHPRWKLRGLQDKYLQRRLADRLLPAELSQGRKRLLHAPLDAFHRAAPPAFVDELISEASLRKAGYFDPQAVQLWRQKLPKMRRGYRRLFVELGLVGVISTQIWHHTFIDGGLASLSSLATSATSGATWAPSGATDA